MVRIFIQGQELRLIGIFCYPFYPSPLEGTGEVVVDRILKVMQILFFQKKKNLHA